jgi:TPR repeat protein
MNDAPVTVGSAWSRARPRLSVLLAAVCFPALLVGAGYGGPTTQSQQSAQQQSTTPEQQFKTVQQKAEQGDAKAQIALGYACAKGQGVPQDDARAMAWYRKAAEQGDAEAQFKLGVIYADEIGVPQDNIEALMWMDLAAARAPDDTEKVLADRLAKKMTAVQIAQAHKRAQEWTLAFEKRKK